MLQHLCPLFIVLQMAVVWSVCLHFVQILLYENELYGKNEGVILTCLVHMTCLALWKIKCLQ